MISSRSAFIWLFTFMYKIYCKFNFVNGIREGQSNYSVQIDIQLIQFFIKTAILSTLNCFVIFVINQVTICVGQFLDTLFWSIDLFVYFYINTTVF